MNVTICTIGELLVEFLAKEENQVFLARVNFGGHIPAAPRQFSPIRWQSWGWARCFSAVSATMRLVK